MRKGFFLSILILTATFCKAQTFEEWFKQNKTQKKYLLQQITALKVYLGYVQKGYAIAQKGLAVISDIKKGDVNLHSKFFQSFSMINPKISRFARVADIIALQLKTMQVYREISRQIRSNKLLNAAEVNIVFEVFNKLLTDCSNIIADVTIVITPGKLEMKDDERLSRIENLYADMQEAYTFAQGFAAETKLLSLQRMKDANDIQTSRSISGIKS